jgi:hypothetical protein
MKKYYLIKDKICIENEQYITYGIKCKTTSVRDISTSKEYVKSIIEALNKRDVAEVHLIDIVEDYLADDEPYICK